MNVYDEIVLKESSLKKIKNKLRDLTGTMHGKYFNDIWNKKTIKLN